MVWIHKFPLASQWGILYIHDKLFKPKTPQWTQNIEWCSKDRAYRGILFINFHYITSNKKRKLYTCNVFVHFIIVLWVLALMQYSTPRRLSRNWKYHSFIHSFIIQSYIHSFIHSIIHPFMQSFIHSFNQSFKQSITEPM